MERMSQSLGSSGSDTRLREQERQEALKQILERQRHVLQAVPTGRPASPDPLEAAQDTEGERIWLAIIDHSQEIQLQVEDAWHRLSEGGYGRCVDCDARIPPARLRALPFALRCLACQERHEASGRRTAAAGIANKMWEDSGSSGELADLAD